MVKLIFIVLFIFVAATLVSMVIGGVYFGSEETQLLDSLRAFKVIHVFGVVPFPIFNIQFFDALWHLLKWDYPFFEGGYGIMRFFLYVISIAVTWIVGIALASVAASIVRRVI